MYNRSAKKAWRCMARGCVRYRKTMGTCGVACAAAVGALLGDSKIGALIVGVGANLIIMWAEPWKR